MISYLIIIIFSVIISAGKQYHKMSYFLVVFVCIFLDWFLRITPPDNDLAVYESLMSSSSYSIYFVREPISFLSMRYLFNILNDANLVFFAIDVLLIITTGVILWFARYPVYGVPILLFNFVMIFGHQNIYRQYIAMIFISLIITTYSSKSRIGLGIIAFLAHNPSLIALLALFRSKNILFNALLVFIGAGLLFVGTAHETASTTETPKHYIFALLIILLLGFTNSRRRHAGYLPFYILAVILLGALLLVSGTAERIYMYLFVVLMPLAILKAEEVIRPRLVGRLILVGVNYAPFFLTSGYLLLR